MEHSNCKHLKSLGDKDAQQSLSCVKQTKCPELRIEWGCLTCRLLCRELTVIFQQESGWCYYSVGNKLDQKMLVPCFAVTSMEFSQF